MAAALTALAALAACRPAEPPADGARPRHLVLVTIDTLRADKVGAYGYDAARTPTIDALAAAGLRAERAFAAAPITLPSHASLLTGRYPPAHGARHNGMAMADDVPTLATALQAAGFATGAFVAAFPLDRRFGLARGFDVYGDRLPRHADGRPADEREGQAVVDEALGWVRTVGDRRMFLWVHLFEPHAPYGRPGGGTSAAARYDGEVAEADRQVGRLLDGLGALRASTLVVVSADHGEAFGEHGEIGHSLFVYDTTLRVPLVLQGPGVGPGVVARDVSLVDVAPTMLGLLGVVVPAAIDGRAFAGPAAAADTGADVPLYAETVAPFEDFGWSPLRAVRAGGLKYIQAPTPELFDLTSDAAETVNLVAARPKEAAAMRAEGERIAAAARAGASAVSPDARRRLQALGYLSGVSDAAGTLVDPKDRRELAARLGQVASGELTGAALESALAGILADDPGNPQAALRLGYAIAGRGDCRAAMPHFRTAIASGMPTADAHLGLAGCLAGARAFAEARSVLEAAAILEPGNPVVAANQGAVRSDGGQPSEAVPFFEGALALDPDFHQARFGLALAHARAGDRAAAAAAAEELLSRLPAAAPQRAEVERLLAAVR